ncbi:hypothetical protein M3P05_17630 [Sansalvadorimonas sp. 2012CJ34-2]|uniref:Uncharacterized protein n=1 Tax=Parendozoicomonas callyspongiae TaxID=2942213 RepID=A0ABT0PK43_9GAMM|nr:hypothetical protein [Sansalvadorimonas sp. 2012CJ34-2]MCL6271743.1 hypothetical protein [Sansalvadorimonas sp. 2012CJ34-2]
MGLPWGVKETVAADHAAVVADFIAKSENTELPLGGDSKFKKAILLKGGLKEMKGKHLLIYRYQLT